MDFTDILWRIGMDPNNDSKLIDITLMVAWGIWKNRNEVRHGKRRQSTAALYEIAIWQREEYIAVQDVSATNNEVFVDQRIWIPPPKNWYKANTNGSVFQDKKWSGVGVIIRDEWGRVVAVVRKKLQVPLETVAIVATAMENAITFARDIGIQKVMFESDSLLICFAIQGKIEVPVAIANLISGTKEHLQYFHQAKV